MAKLSFPGLETNLKPIKKGYYISGIECPLCDEDKCELMKAYNEELTYILTGQVDPDEFKLDNIIEEVKSWK